MQRITTRQSLVLGLGFIAGTLSAWLWLRGARGAVQLPHATLWQRTLADQFGTAEAATLVARMRARYRELYAERPFFEHKALRWHLENAILPGVAAYTVLRGHTDRRTALAQLDHLLVATVQTSPLAQSMRWFARAPRQFALFRWATRRAMQSNYPAPGWLITWLRDDDERIAFNVHRCFYLDVLREYHLPELVPYFCRLDDLMFAQLPPEIQWQRTQTLGRGGKCCDFAWNHVPVGSIQ